MIISQNLYARVGCFFQDTTASRFYIMYFNYSELSLTDVDSKLHQDLESTDCHADLLSYKFL
jgi:hypothetical protein